MEKMVGLGLGLELGLGLKLGLACVCGGGGGMEAKPTYMLLNYNLSSTITFTATLYYRSLASSKRV